MKKLVFMFVAVAASDSIAMVDSAEVVDTVAADTVAADSTAAAE